ncbi:HK97 gp10 family phage protein [Glaesserella parasuis]|uniref:HK97 gp10 family phage protein n=1 Tax=Glaesserella parasuis TaxID=738 RepID=UPI0013211FC3|nr:HK97 gp10 family phage protein [Glaesserella parasuis]MDG6480957.1 HK97 gp10 family phage protein [Glaesserella parasuis]MWQ04285.1 HK97 gp10 family phage protein [Glaesserella parasuis]MWQ83372.1 HK97 gp10 family phage protein [Glaesserella parasuis]
MGVKVKGIKQTKRQLKQLIGEIHATKATRAMSRILNTVAPIAAHYTPVDTSTLINSQFTEMELNGTRLTGRIGYSANYAVYVHDPRVKQNFRKPSAKKEFLTSALKESQPAIQAIIKEELSL